MIHALVLFAADGDISVPTWATGGVVGLVLGLLAYAIRSQNDNVLKPLIQSTLAANTANTNTLLAIQAALVSLTGLVQSLQVGFTQHTMSDNEQQTKLAQQMDRLIDHVERVKQS